MTYPCGSDGSFCPLKFMLETAAHQSWTYLDDVGQMLAAEKRLTRQLANHYGCDRGGVVCPLFEGAGARTMSIANGTATLAEEDDLDARERLLGTAQEQFE